DDVWFKVVFDYEKDPRLNIPNAPPLVNVLFEILYFNYLYLPQKSILVDMKPPPVEYIY
ncbi:hypothetical protein HAX54_022569, partial [Datura stramonium]|nr:hypothetical protein [Datura stramonium]